MKFTIIVFIILIYTNCFKKEELPSPEDISSNSRPNINQCQSFSPIPKGKGGVFQVNEEKAISIATNDHPEKIYNKEKSDKFVVCQTTLFWYITATETNTEYIIDKISGRIISKKTLPFISKIQSTDNTVTCETAFLVGRNHFRKWLLSLGNLEEEVDSEMNQFNAVICEFPYYWIVRFDYKYYDISDLNKTEDIIKLPNVHAPNYLVNKVTGEISVISY